MRNNKSFISLILCVALLITSVASLTAVPAGAAQTKAAPTAANVQTASTAADVTKAQTGADVTKAATGSSGSEQVILHCWNWPFSKIMSELDNIANAGFTAVQTCPITNIVGNGETQVSEWYQFYQPTSYNIGNKLGTEDQFKELCTAAENKGIHVIVDVVLNHVANNSYFPVGSDISSISNPYHTNGLLNNRWDNRWACTQCDYPDGCHDLNTQNSEIQQLALKFLKKCVADGAYGFRFDAAKHIELPSDDSSYASNFWPTVVQNGSQFQYGEVIGGTNTPYKAYNSYMRLNALNMPGNIRGQIQNNQLNAGVVSEYASDGLGGSDIVAWVESHDNFYHNENWKMPDAQIKRAWAAIAAQPVNCLYLARPFGYSDSNKSATGDNDITKGGNGTYYDPEVAAVNKFHTAMDGKGSDVQNVNGNTQVLAVRRYTEGVGVNGICFVNAGSSDINLNGYDTGMADGTYTDTAHNATFTISNHKITSGTLGAGNVYTIYKTASSSEVQLSDCNLYGWINGADYYGSDYTFDSNGSLTATFTKDSYVYINANGSDYLGNQYYSASPGSFYSTNTNYDNKMKVPAGTHTFTLAKSGTGFSLSYTTQQTPTNPTDPTNPSDPTDPTDPTNPSTNAALYIDVSQVNADNPDWYIWTWGQSDGRAVKASYDSASGYYAFADCDTNIQLFRTKANTYTGSGWVGDNATVWNKNTNTNAVTGNLCTVTWGSGDGLNLSFSTYTPPTEPTTQAPTEPPTYDYNIQYSYQYDDVSGTVTKNYTVNNYQSTSTDYATIAQLNDPSAKLGNAYNTYSIDTASISYDANTTTISAALVATPKTYTVTLDDVEVGSDYNYLNIATVTTNEEKAFQINGKVVKTGTEFSFYVTGDIDVTTADVTTARTNATTIDLTATYVSDDKVALELLATANVEDFARMGVAFGMGEKEADAIKDAINNVTTGTGVHNKIAVHNSSVDAANISGLFQFTYAPYMAKAVAQGELYFYTFAVGKNGEITLSDPQAVNLDNLIA